MDYLPEDSLVILDDRAFAGTDKGRTALLESDYSASFRREALYSLAGTTLGDQLFDSIGLSSGLFYPSADKDKRDQTESPGHHHYQEMRPFWRPDLLARNSRRC